MPGQDPNLPPGAPGTAEGPFSRYLTAPLEGKVADDTAREPRPSGYMGTGGKLAMLGASLLRGLQQGKMSAYANREQEKITKFTQDARLVDTVEADPDIPQEVKTKARMLLGQSWATATKEQVAETKKFHGKKGTGFFSHILGGIEHAADTLGGPTPTEHTLGGKDASGAPAREKLMELLAGIHQGGSQYSMKGRFDDTSHELGEYLKGNHDKFKTFEDITKDEKARGHIEKLDSLDSKRAKTVLGLLQSGYQIKSPQEIVGRKMSEQMLANEASGSQPVPGQALTAAAPAGPVPAGHEPAPPPAEPTSHPVEDTVAPKIENPPPPKAFVPYEVGALGTVKSPQEEKIALQHVQLNSKQHKPVYFQRTQKDPRGEVFTQRIEGTYYPEWGVTLDMSGNRLDVEGGGWKKDSAGGKDMVVPITVENPDGTVTKRAANLSEGPATYKAPGGVRPATVREQVGDKVFQYPVDPKTYEQLPGSRRVQVGTVKSGKAGGSGGPKPRTQGQTDSLVTQHNKLVKDEQAQWALQDKYGTAASMPVGKEISDPKTGAKRKVTSELKAQWDKLSKQAKKDALMVQGQLNIKKGQLGWEVGKQEKTEEPKSRAVPVQSGSRSGPSPVSIPAKSKGKPDEKTVDMYLDKAHGDPKRAKELALQDGWEI